jgi:arylsulfatase A-like enzyme
MITQAVRDAGIEDESVFIVTADHGGIVFLFNTDYMELFDHTEIYYQHGGNIPEVRQIPLIFYGKHIKPSAVILSDVHIYDIAPTIAAMFGIPLPLVWLGRSLTDRVCTE